MVSLLILVSSILLIACHNETSNEKNVAKKETVEKETVKKEAPAKTINTTDAVFDYFAQNGINITDQTEQLFLDEIKAVYGYGFTANGIESELYQFRNSEDLDVAKNGFIKDGTDAQQLYTNGPFLLGVYGDNHKLVDMFKQMK